MSEMIDRIANELMKVHAEDINHDEGLKIYYKMARAAIEAMREPTEAMSVAAMEAKRQVTYADIWTAMISAALSPDDVK